MEPITYSLKLNQPDSLKYYSDVRNFAEEILTNSAGSLKPLAEDYIDYLRLYKLEDIREIEEYILELLSFGVLWRVYAHKALGVKYAPFITLSRMAELRKKHQKIKPAIDIARGVLITLFLFRKKSNSQTSIPALEEVDHVCKWLEATGEFREQALRFIRWRAFWGVKNSKELYKIFTTIEEFTNWFSNRAEEVLGIYTEKVNLFLKNAEKNYRWREDRISCMRNRLEYHLNMAGAELMNRAFQKEFLKAEEKVILVPGCMRSPSKADCEAVKVKEGLICRNCTAGCRVNQLSKMGRKYNFEVYVIPHASDLSLWSPKYDRPVRGVVASACVTTLLEGGWELKRYDVPAQCVLLDYCGCQKHWRCNNTPTDLNFKELKRIITN
jgi:hypothetical protein